MRMDPAAREKLGLSEEQWRAVYRAYEGRAVTAAPQNSVASGGRPRVIVGGPPQPTPFPAEERGRLEGLFATFAQATDDAGRQAASEPLLAAAKAMGEQWNQQADEYFASVKNAFGEGPWTAFCAMGP
jgi:hypothetical protein